MAQMRVQRVTGRHAIGLACAVQRQQGAHLIQRHIHGAAQADKAQAVHIAIGVETVLVILAHACREQLLFLVVTNIGGGDARSPGRLTNAPARKIRGIEGHA